MTRDRGVRETERPRRRQARNVGGRQPGHLARLKSCMFVIVGLHPDHVDPRLVLPTRAAAVHFGAGDISFRLSCP